MSELFPCMDVGKVDFDGRDGSGGDGIPQGDARMSISGGVQDDSREPRLGLLNPSDQLTLVVGLAKVDLNPQAHGTLPHHRLDLGKGATAVNPWFALSEQVQVRPVEEQDFHGGAE